MNPVEFLGNIIEVSHSNLEIPARINAILNIISHKMDFNEVIVFTSDKDKRLTCKYKNQKSILFNILNKYRCHIGEGVIGSVAQKRMPQYFNDKDVPLRFGCLFYSEVDNQMAKYKIFAFIPLLDDSYMYGVLVLCSRNRHVLTDAEKILLSIVSREIGGVLRTNDLLLSSKKRISELATLSELGKVLTSNLELQVLLKDIAIIIARALNALFITIKIDNTLFAVGPRKYTYGDVYPQIEHYVNDLEQKAVEGKKTVSLVNHLHDENDISIKHTLHSTPIISKNKVLGTITICERTPQRDYMFEQNEGYLINNFASYITNGLENTLLNIKLKDVVRELNSAQKRIIEQEKFKCLGEMTANIAHEIRNPLVVIGGFAKRLSKKLNMDQIESKYVDIITNEVSRLESILSDVLNYVKDAPVPFESCYINDCIDEVLYLFTTDTAWNNTQILKDYDNNLPPVVCDIQQIKQVLINIIINANEAMDGGGTITIKTETTEEANGRQYVIVSIADSGGGIDPFDINNIFNPFFTTKERGVGLGLAISNKIILNHGGKIELENVVGKGAKFFIYLPVKTIKNGEVFI